jgi:hypothetical protein
MMEGPIMTPEDLQIQTSEIRGRLKALEDRVDEIDAYIQTESRPFHLSISSYRTHRETLEAERERVQKERHRSNSTKLNWLVALATVGTLIVSALSLWLAFVFAKH